MFVCVCVCVRFRAQAVNPKLLVSRQDHGQRLVVLHICIAIYPYICVSIYIYTHVYIYIYMYMRPKLDQHRQRAFTV